MVENKDTVSGKRPEEVMEKIVSKLISVKKSVIKRYESIRDKSKMHNTIQILDDLIEREKGDIEILENAEALEQVMYARKSGKEKDYGSLDHIISADPEPEKDDPKSILAWSISKSNEIYKIAELLSLEYEDDNLKKLLKNIAESEMKRKNRITELYEDIINKDDW
ncbi:MAG: hypothetical protein M1498_02285 [Candidatus Thermoplasmatota archaeon]|nr:hypothetical protein [Candidatus Thermoplasmatota archaeon]MCL5888564.1 hypothetical protein [Candidatus Thermoplasmatota archaeon]